MPTILFNATSNKTMENLGLGQYEITLCEPLHDYSNHVKNLITEIPAQLSKQGKECFVSAIEVIFKDKQTIRGCDYRDAAVVLPQILQGKEHIPNDIIQLFNSVSEIGRLLYSKESQRTSQSVLRLHLVVWTHWVQLRELFTTKIITKRKLWGYYAHALLFHAPIFYRLISPRQLNTEDEERMFGTLKDITKRTSSRRAGEIEYNSLIRLQEETKQQNYYHCSTHDKVISKHAANTQPINTIVKQTTMEKYSHHWQALLEKNTRLSD